MKSCILLVLLSLVVHHAAAESAPLSMPTEVTLTTGRVLRNVSVVRWESNRVVLKHAAGADPIPFALFRSPAPTELPALRAGFEATKKAASEQTKAAVVAPEPPKKYEGQAFIVTRGAGNYKLGDMVVRIYLKPAEELREILRWSSSLPAPDAIATTDADGKFTFTAPAEGPVTMVAKKKRLVGSREEKYLWVSDASNGANRFEPRLTSNNLEPEPHLESQAYNSL